MRVLIADPLALGAVEALEALGLEVDHQPELNANTLARAIEGASILIVGDTGVSRRSIEHAEALNLIVRAGRGTEAIDLKAASERGIYVTHCPDYDNSARAELVLGMMVALDRGIGIEGETTAPRGLRDRVLGLCGYGPGAAEVRSLAAALSMRIYVYSETLTSTLATESGFHLCTDVETLFRRADIVSLHPEDQDATGADPIVTAERLELLGDGGVLINTWAPALVDAAAVRSRLEAGTLRAGFDAPPTADWDPAGAPGQLVTSGIAGATDQAAASAFSEVLRIVHSFLAEEPIPNCVNLESQITSAAVLVVRQQNKVGSLARILEILRESDINVLDVHNVIFTGGAAACTRIWVSAVPGPALLKRIRQGTSVLEIEVIEL